jgi:SAM-dependent methyltransferase
MKQVAKQLAGFMGVSLGNTCYGITPVGGHTNWLIRGFARMATRWNLRRFQKAVDRKLEIGPGPTRIAGFETINVIFGLNVDYVWDATTRMPFSSDTFALIYASHILEHVPWYQTAGVLKEWVRILRPGGSLEIWVPDGLKICRAFVEAETSGLDPFENDPWTRFNDERDPCKWASGRVFTYGDGSGNINDPNWHRALFSPRYLQTTLQQAGLIDVAPMDRNEVRGYDHGWINLGMKGFKPPVR